MKEATVIATTPDGRELRQQIRFQDFAYFKTIHFEEPVITVRLIIDIAYRGSKWQDTAVSAFIPPPIYREVYMELPE